MEVCDWFTRSWRTLTQDELRSMAVLMPENTGRATASPGRYTNTGRRAEASAVPQIQEQIVDKRRLWDTGG